MPINYRTEKFNYQQPNFPMFNTQPLQALYPPLQNSSSIPMIGMGIPQQIPYVFPPANLPSFIPMIPPSTIPQRMMSPMMPSMMPPTMNNNSMRPGQMRINPGFNASTTMPINIPNMSSNINQVNRAQ
jgi:hypothetical protein